MDLPAGSIHESVMVDEVLTVLSPSPGEIAIDATCGAGGHARSLWERVQPEGALICVDQDPAMLAFAKTRFPSDANVRWLHTNFENVAEVVRSHAPSGVDMVLADLGFCSDQLADSRRGFSFQHDGPLDMRLDPTRGEPASTLLRRLSERDLADILWRYGEERHSRRVAKRIVETRQKTPILTTTQLADLVRSCVPRGRGHSIDPATRTFQGIRIAVNDELGALERFLEDLPHVLRPGGRAAIISFHSLEDRLVKQAFRKNPDLIKEINRKPLTASESEQDANPRSRSAKLRAVRKL